MRCARALLGLLLLTSMPLHAQEPIPDAVSDPQEFAREWTEAWNSGRIGRILEFYDPEAVYEDVPNVENGWAVPWHGQEMIGDALGGMFGAMPDLGFETVSVRPSGGWMIAEWIMTGTHEGDFPGLPATGRSISIRGISLIDIEDGRIVLQRDYYDMFRLLAQLGAVPPLSGE